MRRMAPALVAGLWALTPAQAQPGAPAPGDVRLTDAELARATGRFILPNGAELALTVTSDTAVDGRLLLRTVLTVDKGSSLQVLAPQPGAAPVPYAAARASAGGGVTVALDRRSGMQTVAPDVAVAIGPAVSVGAVVANPPGLAPVAVTPGGPAVATADGVVSLDAVPGGARVTFAGDQLGIVNQVGRSIATAVANSANDRTLDTVTNITIDARNLAPYQAGIAQMRVGELAVEATRGTVR